MTDLTKRQGYQSQNLSEGTNVAYWGYAVRVLPCTNDPGTCEYFEAVYGGHETGMLYTGILWATLGGLIFLFAVGRHFWARQRGAELVASSVSSSRERSSALTRLTRSVGSAKRRFLLPDSIHVLFGRVTRLQVLILLILTGYLTIFSFAGITYRAWRTPVKGYDNLYQTRSALGPWSDRVGVLAYALTPFSVFLATRESILSQLTGIPYQSFNFLHRWLGYGIFVQALLHTIGWTLIETVFYQPQPQVANKWIKQLYMIWGCVAMILILILFILSTPWMIRRTGYEFFRKSHYVLAITYIGACWGHWKPLKAFMAPALALWFADRFLRFLRSGLIHYQYLPSGGMGFRTSTANVKVFADSVNGAVVRLDIVQAQRPWHIGQHFYLCFPELSIWQSHPFTPCSLPNEDATGKIRHSYVLRARKGITARLASLSVQTPEPQEKSLTASVIFQGPYGENLVEHLCPNDNVIAIAGGTGITYALPVLTWLVHQKPSRDRKIALIWVVRLQQDTEWVREELDVIMAEGRTYGINVKIHVTREHITEGNDKTPNRDSKTPSSSSLDTDDSTRVLATVQGRPDIDTELAMFIENNVRGRTVVYASGPGEMITDIRAAVARLNDPPQVFRGRERFDIDLICNDRLEW
jgi:predicted ferric reductase